MKNLLGLLIYEHGQRAIPDTHHFVYAAIANRKIVTATLPGGRAGVRVKLRTQIVEIGVSKLVGPPTQRLLGGSKAINAARLFAHNIDCVHYVELTRVPRADRLSATNFENVITRWLCMASCAWPLANQVKGNVNLETGLSYRVAHDPKTDEIFRIVKTCSSRRVAQRLDLIRDIFRGWTGGPAQLNQALRPVVGLRQLVPVVTGANPRASNEPTAVRLNMTRGRINQLDTCNGVDRLLYKKVPGRASFTRLAASNNGMNADRNTVDEDNALANLNAI